jgi:hypothetical protein
MMGLGGEFHIPDFKFQTTRGDPVESGVWNLEFSE